MERKYYLCPQKEERKNGLLVHRKELDDQPMVENYLGPMFDEIDYGKIYLIVDLYRNLCKNLTYKAPKYSFDALYALLKITAILSHCDNFYFYKNLFWQFTHSNCRTSRERCGKFLCINFIHLAK